MSAVLAALFPDHQTAEQVRVQLVRDGFPTDRVELSSRQELGQSELVAADSTQEKLLLHFRRLFPQEENAENAKLLSRAVLDGRAVIAVQPRGEVETHRALEILGRAGPMELRERDLENQPLERAAAPGEETLVPNVEKILLGPGATR